MIFRILNTVRKHNLAVRYAGRHLLWTAPALYGYYSLYRKLAETYSTGCIGVAREVAVSTQGTVRQYLAGKKEQERQQEDGSCCQATRTKQQQEARAGFEDRMMFIVHGIGACGI